MPRPIEHGYPPASLQVHIDRNGQRFGPYTVEELNTYLAGGQVLPTDRAWYEGLADFGPLANIPGVQLPGAAAPPPPPRPPPPNPFFFIYTATPFLNSLTILEYLPISP